MSKVSIVQTFIHQILKLKLFIVLDMTVSHIFLLTVISELYSQQVVSEKQR